MTSDQHVSRSQLEWHCRRGMRELDVLLMRYVEQHYDAADEGERAAFETLLSLQDPEILDLLTGRIVAKDVALNHVIQRLLANARSEDI